MRNKNKERRYRLRPEIALKLGLDTRRKDNKYRLNKEQEKQLFDMDLQPVKRLFFDIETSPCIGYFWQPSYKARITYENIIEPWKVICISYKWENEDKVNSVWWDKQQNDKQLLKDFIEIANKADELVAHNGDRFDIKKVRTRCIYHRIPTFPKYRTLDTLKKSRGNFAFPSNRLNDIGLFLGVGEKLETGGFQLWKEVMQGNDEALKHMVEYCEKDVLLLEDVFLTLQNYIKPNIHVGVLNGNLKASCPSCGSEDTGLLKNNFTPTGTIKRLMECNTCNHTYEISNSSYRMFLEMKSNL